MLKFPEINLPEKTQDVKVSMKFNDYGNLDIYYDHIKIFTIHQANGMMIFNQITEEEELYLKRRNIYIANSGKIYEKLGNIGRDNTYIFANFV